MVNPLASCREPDSFQQTFWLIDGCDMKEKGWSLQGRSARAQRLQRYVLVVFRLPCGSLVFYFLCRNKRELQGAFSKSWIYKLFNIQKKTWLQLSDDTTIGAKSIKLLDTEAVLRANKTKKNDLTVYGSGSLLKTSTLDCKMTDETILSISFDPRTIEKEKESAANKVLLH